MDDRRPTRMAPKIYSGKSEVKIEEDKISS